MIVVPCTIVELHSYLTFILCLFVAVYIFLVLLNANIDYETDSDND